jgi:hypothetical protein
MWINGKFLKANGHSVQEHGGFELKAAALDAETTKVSETRLGITPAHADAVGHPPGHAFHFMLADTILKDDCIPRLLAGSSRTRRRSRRFASERCTPTASTGMTRLSPCSPGRPRWPGGPVVARGPGRSGRFTTRRQAANSWATKAAVACPGRLPRTESRVMQQGQRSEPCGTQNFRILPTSMAMGGSMFLICYCFWTVHLLEAWG